MAYQSIKYLPRILEIITVVAKDSIEKQRKNSESYSVWFGSHPELNIRNK